jgi:hypothetical protein
MADKEVIEVAEAVRRLVGKFRKSHLEVNVTFRKFQLDYRERWFPNEEPSFVLALMNAKPGHEESARLSALEDFFIQLLSSEGVDDGNGIG